MLAADAVAVFATAYCSNCEYGPKTARRVVLPVVTKAANGERMLLISRQAAQSHRIECLRAAQPANTRCDGIGQLVADE